MIASTFLELLTFCQLADLSYTSELNTCQDQSGKSGAYDVRFSLQVAIICWVNSDCTFVGRVVGCVAREWVRALRGRRGAALPTTTESNRT